MTTGDAFRVAHLSTVDMTLALVLMPQLVALRDAGADVIGVSGPGPWVADLTDRGIRHVALPASTRGMHPIADLRAAVQLWRVLRAERPTILHTHTPKPGVYGRVVGRIAGVPACPRRAWRRRRWVCRSWPPTFGDPDKSSTTVEPVRGAHRRHGRTDRRLVVDDGLWYRMGVAARPRCLERFTLEASAALWRDTFEPLLR